MPAGCLDVNAGRTAAGTPSQIWDCHSGTNRTWTRTASGRLTVHSGDGARCATALNNRTAPGTAVAISPCHGGANQQRTVGQRIRGDATRTDVIGPSGVAE